jgi:hypothetical protein
VSRRGRAQLITALLALTPLARELGAQQAPPDWHNRSLIGGGIQILTANGFSAPMAVLRATEVRDDLVVPDVTAGLYAGSGTALVDVDVGIGKAVALGEDGVLTITGGPGVFLGAGAIVDLHAEAAVIFRFGGDIGIRLEAGRRFLSPGQYNIGLWMFGFGLTSLGGQRPAARP